MKTQLQNKNYCWAKTIFLSLQFIIFFPFVSIAQNTEQRNYIISQTNVSALQQISQIDGSYYQNRRIIAEQWAISNGYAISGVKENGQEFRIYDYDSIYQIPLYLVTHNLNSAKTISTDKLWVNGTSGFDLTGSQITITMWDGGRVCDQHPEYINRATSGPFETTVELISPHATHVAGTQIAEGITQNAKGMAPQSEIIYYGALDWPIELPLEAANGWLLSNHSYGHGNEGWAFEIGNWYWHNYPNYTEFPRFGLYTYWTQLIDQISNAAPYFLMIRSAGNDRGVGQQPNLSHYHDLVCCFTDFHQINGIDGYDCIGEMPIAKNVLAVGAIEDIPGGYTNPSDVILASFSSTGPTDDGRIKPDIVANGIDLNSTFNNSSCNLLNYHILSGTSMSAPSVTGSCALLQEHYSNTHSGSFMLASTIKALILETTDEAGANNGPDYQYGWGLMNTKKAAELISKDQIDPSLIQELTIPNNQTIDIPITITSSNNCYLSATIVWNDPAATGHSLNPPPLDPPDLMLINDLDLRIIDPNTNIHYPWTLDPANPANAAVQTTDNFRDNVEQVRIYNALPGNYIVRITHKGTLTNPQAFSIIIDSPPALDIYIKDTPEDIGVESNPDNGPMWVSEDIWVRRQQDGLLEHQNPLYDPLLPDPQYNWVYVRVRNRGCQALDGIDDNLKLYWSKAASALDWDSFWNGSQTCNGGPSMGNIVGTQSIPSLQPGGETILAYQWEVKNPDLYNSCNTEPWHFCFLARIETADDPMHSLETQNLYYNVQQNNNIAWKNVTVVNPPNSPPPVGDCESDVSVGGVIAVGNPYSDNEDSYDLIFKLPDNYEGNILDQAEIRITLDPITWQKWVNGGYQGTNVEVRREDCRQIIILGDPASIENLTYDVEERSTLNVSFNFLVDEITSEHEFDYHVIQTRHEDQKVIGGELYQIRRNERASFDADAGGDQLQSKNDSTTLSASSIGEPAIYNWYDETGNLVYTGQNFTVSAEITTKYKLEVIALADGFVDYDSLTVQVKEFEITSITPNPATNQITVEYDTENASSAFITITQAFQNGGNNYMLDITESSTIINLAGYFPGIYNVILFCNGEAVDTKQLVIQ